MKRFHNFSLQTKLTIVSMLTCLPVLVLTAIFFIQNERTTYRNELIHSVSTLAKVIGINSSAALVFQDPNAARETLAALSAEPFVAAAAIIRRDEGLFAAYQKGQGETDLPEQPSAGADHLADLPPGFIDPGAPSEKHHFTGNAFMLVQPILFRSEPIGQVFIRVNLEEFNEKLTLYVLIVLGVLLAAAVAAFFLSARLQLLISRPILNLAEKVRLITREANYAVRAEKTTNDEIGELIGGFNEMLTQIEKRDAELATHRDNLESQVADRTAELANAVASLETEMSERKRTQRALEQSEVRYREMFANMSNGVAVFRKHPEQDGFVLTDMNKAAEKIVAAKRDTVLGLPLEVIASPYAHLGLDEVLHRVWQKGGAEHVPVRRYDGGSKALWLEYFAYKLITDDIVLIFIDETDKKQAEVEKTRMESQLLRAQKMEAIGMLAGGVAHDLNNILSGIMSYPELLLLDLEDGHPMKSPLEMIQNSGQRAAAIVQDLLTLARRGVAVTETVSLKDIVTEYLESPEFRKLISYHAHIDIKADMGDGSFNVKGSAVHLSKTVMNLTSNAVEAMPDGGAVTISVERVYVDTPVPGYDSIEPGDFIILRVADEGIGISAEDLERIFEPFYTKKVMGRSGTGLGMAVVWGTVKDHQGYIDVKSAVGRGTQFTLYFPEVEESAPATTVGYSSVLPQGNGEMILVIDDVEEQRQIACAMLQRLGYSAEAVASGEEAVAYVQQTQPDLLLLDMIMDPGIDGYETYRRILKYAPGQKALIASGFSESRRARMTQELGAGAYLKKPYNFDQFARAVQKELNRDKN